jgi:hypothetical protein
VDNCHWLVAILADESPGARGMTRTADAAGLALNASSPSFHRLQLHQNTRDSRNATVSFEISEQACFLGTSLLQAFQQADELT